VVNYPEQHHERGAEKEEATGRRFKITIRMFRAARGSIGKNGSGRVRRATTPRRRKPTPLQTARWRAVRKAKRQGLSIRGIARKLGIHRTTVRKYLEAKGPPMSPARTPSKAALSDRMKTYSFR